MPIVATALIARKDAYNAGSPEDDIGGTLVNEIVGSVVGLHGAPERAVEVASLNAENSPNGDALTALVNAAIRAVRFEAAAAAADRALATGYSSADLH
ncbi:MAG: hypothetical protein ACJAYU_002573 [Bradymonadia bacterium]|jgi:hypothetical protein